LTLNSLLETFCHKSYITMIDPEDDELPVIEKSFQYIQKGFEELLQHGLLSNVDLNWIDFNTFCEILGMLRLNTHVISISSPLREYLLAIDSLPKHVKKSSIPKLVPYINKISVFFTAKRPTDEEQDDSDDDEDDQDDPAVPLKWPKLKPGTTTSIFPGSIGSGLYPKISMLNHSCLFNASIEFPETNRALVLATKNIEPGEEIFITYVPEGTLAERAEKLRDYGFNCNCPKCTDERKEHI